VSVNAALTGASCFILGFGFGVVVTIRIMRWVMGESRKNGK